MTPSTPEPVHHGPALTVADVARDLSCHPSTVRGFIARRELEAFTLGGEYRIKGVHLASFLEARRLTASADPTNVTDVRSAMRDGMRGDR